MLNIDLYQIIAKILLVDESVDTEAVDKDFGSHTLYLNVRYDVTESLNVYGYYGYEIAEKEFVKDGSTCNDGKYYGDFGIGWSYSF